jgi:hypothetical protein
MAEGTANLSLGHRESIISDILIKQELARRQVWNLCSEHVASFERGPLLWLCKHTCTEDLHWLQKGTPPVAPFPDKSYLLCAMVYLLTCDTLFIPKSREMMTSWLVCGYIAWMTQWLPHIFWILQTEKEDKATQLINYCRILYNRQPDWMKERNPLVVSNSVELKRANGSHILAVPQGENQVRLFHPYGYMQDESAFLPEAEQSFNAVRPVCKQIVAVSSDEVGWFHNECKR